GNQKEDGEPVMKPFWDITPEEAKTALDDTKWCPANLEYFRGGGFSSQFLSEGGMPVTMTRINIIKGLWPVLQIAEGQTVELCEYVHETINQHIDQAWPTTLLTPRLSVSYAFIDVHSVMYNFRINHGVLSYGHIGDEFITLASMLSIPVAMHNVPR